MKPVLVINKLNGMYKCIGQIMILIPQINIYNLFQNHFTQSNKKIKLGKKCRHAFEIIGTVLNECSKMF